MARLNVESSTATTLVIDGVEFRSFAGCNYLGLAQHPDVLTAAADGLSRFGLSTTASRETTGNTGIHDLLEVDLATFTRQEAAILLAEGYTANFAVAQGLAPHHAVALIDARAHRSIRNAATAAGMQVFEYEHLNPDSAAWLARQYTDQGVAIFTDGIFAADGAVAPLPGLLAALPPIRSALVVDDCHGFCVMGEGGRGLVDHFRLDDPRICITTTLAKGLGCYGGAVIGRAPLIDRIRGESDVYRRSTPVPTPIAIAARAAMKVLRSTPELTVRLRANIAAARAALQGAGVNVHDDEVPVFTFILKQGSEVSEARMEACHQALLRSGIYAPLIEYPGGPTRRYFRLTVTACHTEDDIARLGRELKRELMRG